MDEVQQLSTPNYIITCTIKASKQSTQNTTLKQKGAKLEKLIHKK
jgi:hypothetical protein